MARVKSAMVKRVAERWLVEKARPEYRLTVYATASGEQKNLPSLLRAFRDGRTKIGSIQPITDLGVSETPQSLDLWSANREAMSALDKWLIRKGYETTGVW